MSAARIPVFVERPPQKQYAEIILRSYPVSVISGGWSSGTIGSAIFSLMAHPEQPIAVLIESETENERQIAEVRGSAKRLLARAAPEGWYFAFAIPTLESWLLTDPKVKDLLDSHLQDGRNAIERSERIVGLLAGHSFDPTELLRTNDNFRGLVDFVMRHSSADPEVVESVST